MKYLCYTAAAKVSSLSTLPVSRLSTSPVSYLSTTRVNSISTTQKLSSSTNFRIARNYTNKTSGACPPGWKQWNRNCYYFPQTAALEFWSWYTATKRCSELDPAATLACIRTEAENEFILKTVKELLPAVVSEIWIGFQQNATRKPVKQY